MYSLITDRITISRKSPVMVSHLIFITRFSTTSPTTLGGKRDQHPVCFRHQRTVDLRI